MQFWLRESLKRRLNKSLACDWMRPETVKHFPLRQFYVQLEWQKKVHHALSTEKVTLHSVHELIKEMSLSAKITGLSRILNFIRRWTSDWWASPGQTQQAAYIPKSTRTSNVIIEGKGPFIN